MRTIQDDQLRRWEAYATTGEFGSPDHARIVFRCLTDPGERARVVTLDGDKADAEEAVDGRSDSELNELLRDASELA